MPLPKPTNCICAAIINTWSCGCHTYTYRVTCLGPIYHDPPKIVASKLHWRETCEKCGERLPAAERAWMQRRGVLEYTEGGPRSTSPNLEMKKGKIEYWWE
jgi:hypothetical protein